MHYVKELLSIYMYIYRSQRQTIVL